MKITFPSLVALGVLAAFPVAVQVRAQPAPKIAVVDMDQLYRNYWKTKDQEVKLQDMQKKAQTEVDQMKKDLDTVVGQLKELQDESKNPIETADAKAKAQSDFQKLYGQAQQKQQDLGNFVQSVRSEIAQKVQTFHELMVQEITGIATKIAQEHGATVLFDESGVGITQTKGVLWSDPSYDITKEVAAELEKGRPATPPAASAPAGTVPAVPSTTPGSSAPITVPGVTPSN